MMKKIYLRDQVLTSAMAFPVHEFKHSEDALFSPEDYLKYQREKGRYFPFKAPEGIIICYHGGLLRYIVENYKTRREKGFWGETYLLETKENEVGIIGKFGIGAPIVAAMVEELVVLGAREFISIGTAGSLRREIKIGDLVICNRAIRDEGTSHHYLPPSKYAYASEGMLERMERSFQSLSRTYTMGTSWTTDAPYRETRTEVMAFQKEGVSTVEMEASALFAVGQRRRVEVGAMFAISDSLAELEWKPGFSNTDTQKGLEKLFEVALDVLREKRE